MKKVLAVLMAVLMIFSCMSVVALAADDDDEEIVVTYPQENTTRNILNDDGLVVPINFNQLKFSTIFKVIEKLFKFIINLFTGEDAESTDQSLADAISSLGDDIASAIEEGSQFIDDNQ